VCNFDKTEIFCRARRTLSCLSPFSQRREQNRITPALPQPALAMGLRICHLHQTDVPVPPSTNTMLGVTRPFLTRALGG